MADDRAQVRVCPDCERQLTAPVENFGSVYWHCPEHGKVKRTKVVEYVRADLHRDAVRALEQIDRETQHASGATGHLGEIARGALASLPAERLLGAVERAERAEALLAEMLRGPEWGSGRPAEWYQDWRRRVLALIVRR